MFLAIRHVEVCLKHSATDYAIARIFPFARTGRLASSSEKPIHLNAKVERVVFNALAAIRTRLCRLA